MTLASERRKRRHVLARAIGRALLSQWPNIDAMVECAATALGGRWMFLDGLVSRAVSRFHSGPCPPTLRAVSEFVEGDPGFLSVWSRGHLELGSQGAGHPQGCVLDPIDKEALELGLRMQVCVLFLLEGKMRPARPWPVPPLETEGELASFLSLRGPELEFLASLGRGELRRPPGPLRNYVYTWRRKGNGRERLIEAPKLRLKNVQRRILRKILAEVPPHDAAHGFRPGRSLLTHAQLHVGRRVVVRMDLAEFFLSISAARIAAVFHTIGYPERVARLLAALTTNTTPRDVLQARRSPWDDPWLRQHFTARHLPQGAPSSPALANLVAFRLDRRLDGLARAFGARYSRYADDLAFSGDHQLAGGVDALVARVAAIASEEGFRVHPRKTRVMRAGVRQKLTGLLVNTRPNVLRKDYEKLKAILHNAARTGPAAQNRDGHRDFRAHLLGRIAHVAMVHPARGAKLKAAFDRVTWG